MYSILSLAIPVITTPYISRVFTATDIGDYSYTAAIEGYFALFATLGVTGYARREIAYRQNNKIELKKFFCEIIFVRLTLVFVATIFYVILCLLSSEYSLLYFVQIFALVSVAIDISWYFQGMEDFKSIAIRDMIIRIISTILIFVLVKQRTDIWKYALINALASFISALYMWRYIPLETSFKNLNYIETFEHFKKSLNLLIPIAAINVYTTINKVMLKALSDATQVGYYTQAEKIIKIILTIITTLGIVMSPRIASLYAEEKLDEIKKHISSSIQVILFLCMPMIFGVMAISNKFVPLFFGNGYDEVSGLMKILSPLFLFIGLSGSIGGPLLVPLKRENKYSISVVVGALINAGINYLLIPGMKSTGAAIATVIAECVVMIISMIFCKDFLDLSIILKAFLTYGSCSIGMFLITRILNYIIDDSIAYCVCAVVVGFLFYIGILFLTKDRLLIKLVKLLNLQKILLHQN